MFTTQSMRHVSLLMLNEHTNSVVSELADLGVFSPVTQSREEFPEDSVARFRSEYQQALNRWQKLMEHFRFDPGLATTDAGTVSLAALQEANTWLDKEWLEASQTEERLRELREEEKRQQQLLQTLKTFTALDVDLGLLKGDERFLAVKLGSVPRANFSRLQEAVNLTGYVLSAFFQDEQQVFLVILGAPEKQGELDQLLHAAGWHELKLPEEFRAHPRKVENELLKSLNALLQQQQVIEDSVLRLAALRKKQLLAVGRLLKQATPLAQVGEGLRSQRRLTLITGWVPQKSLDEVQQRLKAAAHPVAFAAREPRGDESVPSLLRYHAWLKPFAGLVGQYGVPRYGEFDPTILFAISFVLMFGMMFGDIGHGLVIALGAWWQRNKLKNYTIFGIAIGVSSAIFGIFYGSIFGFEHWIHPLWMSPMSDPNLMLRLALYWGMGFIGLATLLSIFNHWQAGELSKALFDKGGFAGLILYLALLFNLGLFSSGQDLSHLSLGSLLLPLLIVMGYQWVHSEGAVGERLLTTFIEGFETVMSYFSSTLSFLRVAAFSLNHVALATAVMTLAAMMDGVGHFLTIVAGNIFILVLEGAIVAIQVMRLEYYEGFSRFFHGDGKAFKPLLFELPSIGRDA